jgi:hypothetical protein
MKGFLQEIFFVLVLSIPVRRKFDCPGGSGSGKINKS